MDPIPDADVRFPVTFNGANYEVYVRKRPHLDKFFALIAGKFEVTVFTASQQVYAERLLNLLDPEGKHIHNRLYRDSCLNVDGNFLKDLNVLGRDLTKTVLVDNSPHAFGYQLDNGVPIESWFEDKSDTELLKVRGGFYAAPFHPPQRAARASPPPLAPRLTPLSRATTLPPQRSWPPLCTRCWGRTTCGPLCASDSTCTAWWRPRSCRPAMGTGGGGTDRSFFGGGEGRGVCVGDEAFGCCACARAACSLLKRRPRGARGGCNCAWGALGLAGWAGTPAARPFQGRANGNTNQE